MTEDEMDEMVEWYLMSLSKFQELVMDRAPWHAAFIAKSQT